MDTTLTFDRLPARTGSSSIMTDNVTGLREVLKRRGQWHPGSLAA
ncbi:hypothetical protein [Nonomuraea basaltis]|nr:hypothetical protein [Nonomuraea basaltis]